MEDLLKELLDLKAYSPLPNDDNPDNIHTELDYTSRIEDLPHPYDEVIKARDLKAIIVKYVKNNKDEK
jgi:hypothetical protein